MQPERYTAWTSNTAISDAEWLHREGWLSTELIASLHYEVVICQYKKHLSSNPEVQSVEERNATHCIKKQVEEAKNKHIFDLKWKICGVLKPKMKIITLNTY